MSTERVRNFYYKKAIGIRNDGDDDEDNGYGDDEDEDEDERGLSQLSWFNEIMFIWTHYHLSSSTQGCPLFPVSVKRFYKWCPTELFSLGDYGRTDD